MCNSDKYERYFAKGLVNLSFSFAFIKFITYLMRTRSPKGLPNKGDCQLLTITF